MFENQYLSLSFIKNQMPLVENASAGKNAFWVTRGNAGCPSQVVAKTIIINVELTINV